VTTTTIDHQGLLNRAWQLRATLVRLRRSIHQVPELGFEEELTRACAREVLVSNGWDVVADSAPTGLVAALGPDPHVLLRASIDALPIQDPKAVDYRSTVPGVAHACGHDAQVAVLVGAARLLHEVAPGAPVAVLFQPAEEIDTGAQSVIDSGALSSMSMSTVIGFHGQPALRSGQIGLTAGPVMACISTVRATVSGVGCHGAEPHLGSDAVTALAALISDWQVMLGRRIDGRSACVLSVGVLEAGSTPNVIPSRARLEGTLRYVDPELKDRLHGVLRQTAAAVAHRFDVTVDLTIDEVVHCLVNDPDVTAVVRDAVASTLGDEALVPVQPALGGDDFAFLAQRTPGCYFFLGEGQQNRPPYGWHDPTFDIDEDSIPVGSAVLAAAALTALERRGR